MRSNTLVLPFRRAGLEALPFFQEAGLNRTDISSFLPHVKARKVAPNEVICSQGEQPDYFFVILRGTCTVVVEHSVGTDTIREKQVGSLAVGDAFGEVSLLTGKPRTATVRASSEGCVLAFNASAYHRHFQRVLERRVGHIIQQLRSFPGEQAPEDHFARLGAPSRAGCG